MSNSDNIDNQEAVKLEAYKPKPDCAVCGQPYHRHNIGSHVLCPIIATYRPLPPAKLDAPDNQEALAGEGVELAKRLRRACDPLNHVWRHERDELGTKAADMLERLSTMTTRPAGVEEVERLRRALIECGRAAGAFVADGVTTDFLLHVPEEVRAKIAALTKPTALPLAQPDLASIAEVLASFVPEGVEWPAAQAIQTMFCQPAALPKEGEEAIAIEALSLARPIVEADMEAAKESGDEDWIGQSLCALDAIDRALSSLPVSGEVAVEKVCERCGGHNPVWFAPNSIWNFVVGDDNAIGDPGGIRCPNCFIAMAEQRGMIPTAWSLRPEPPFEAPLERAARELYTAQVGDVENRHSRAWSELSDGEQTVWRERAALTPPQATEEGV